MSRACVACGSTRTAECPAEGVPTVVECYACGVLDVLASDATVALSEMVERIRWTADRAALAAVGKARRRTPGEALEARAAVRTIAASGAALGTAFMGVKAAAGAAAETIARTGAALRMGPCSWSPTPGAEILSQLGATAAAEHWESAEADRAKHNDQGCKCPACELAAIVIKNERKRRVWE